MLSGHPELIGPMWSWGIDTATHALRLIFGKTFDRFPTAKLLLGHMGEGLPFVLWRLDSRWGFHNHHGVDLDREVPSEYLRQNLYITTSGVCSAAPLHASIEAIGAEHILFGTDYPFESIPVACEFIETVAISDADREAITHGNAESLLAASRPAAV